MRGSPRLPRITVTVSPTGGRARCTRMFPVKFSVLLAFALCMLLSGWLCLWLGVRRTVGPGGAWGVSMRKVCNEVPKGIRLHMSPLGVNFLFPARGGVDMVAA